MKKIFVISTLIFIVLATGELAAQKEALNYVDKETYEEKILKIQNELTALKQSNEINKKALTNIGKKIISTENLIQDNKLVTQKQINELSRGSDTTMNHINDLGDRIGKNRYQWIIGTSMIGILGMAGLFIAITSRRRFSEDHTILEKKFSEIRNQLDSASIKVDGRLIELLQNYMKLIQTEQEEKSRTERMTGQHNNAIDHTLPIRIGEEIFRMRQRLNVLPADTKGLKPLNKSLERLEEEFNRQGYEMVNMVGLKYDEGMSLKARFVASDNLDIGEAIITKVIRPQINYKGTAIQDAEIEVSTGG